MLFFFCLVQAARDTPYDCSLFAFPKNDVAVTSFLYFVENMNARRLGYDGRRIFVFRMGERWAMSMYENSFAPGWFVSLAGPVTSGVKRSHDTKHTV